MSYARQNEESDVYVYDSGDGVIVCQWCKLGTENRNCTRAEMVEHLRLHQAAGHKVPEYAFARLQVELSGEALTAGEEIAMFEDGTHPMLPPMFRRGEN